jgi:ADP-ribosylglycohydrolase
LKNNPVTDMTGFGTYNQPPGTWSDDSSLTLCLADSLCDGFDVQDIANTFCKWLEEGLWTARGVVFDIGNATWQAIERLKQGEPPLEAGSRDENSNGNGSLMRCLPLAFYLRNHDIYEKFDITHQVSCLTHGHLRSQMACGFYIQFATGLLDGLSPKEAYGEMIRIAAEYYAQDPYEPELHHFSRLMDSDIYRLPEEEIWSDGYVVHTLEAGLWCFLNNDTYADVVLRAVNLGDDTDTTAAVAGGLAGIYYGFRSIPKKWRTRLVRIQDIMDLADRLESVLTKETY